MEQNQINELLDLGAWIGRRQTFGVIAGRCSAAEAKCLQEIRQARKYRAYDLTWDEFCTRHVGISRSLADRLIRQLEEFGETYFQLAAVTRITPEHYRLIAGAVSEDGLECAGEKIVIEPANAARLSAAVEKLIDGRPRPAASSQGASDEFYKAGQRLTAAVAEFERLSTGDLDFADRVLLQTVVASSRDRLSRLRQKLRIS